MKTFISLFFACLALNGWGRDTIAIKQWAIADAIILDQPVMVDDVNVFGNSFDAKAVLNIKVNESAFTRNVRIVSADSAGYVVNNQQDDRVEMHFFSFQFTPLHYTKANLIVTSSRMIEIFVNGKKMTEKRTEQNNMKEAIPTELQLKLIPQQYTVTIKYLSPALDYIKPTLKAILTTDNGKGKNITDVTAQDEKRMISMDDITQGERLSGLSVSPDGKYAITVSSLPMNESKRKTFYKVFELASGKTIITVEDKEMRWMPTGSELYYLIDTENGRGLVKKNLTSLETTLITDNLPEGNFAWAPNGEYLIFSILDKFPRTNGVRRILTPQDRQDSWRSRASLYRYDIQSGIMQPLTFGFNTTSLVDISQDSKKIIFSTSKDRYTERPFSVTSYYLLHLASMKVDTLWKDLKYGDVLGFSPDGKQLLLAGGPEAFDGSGKNMTPNTIANNYDKQLFIYTLTDQQAQDLSPLEQEAIRKSSKASPINTAQGTIVPITREFNPSVKNAQWSTFDNNIYLNVDEGDRIVAYRYLTKTAKFEKLNFPVDLVQQLDLAHTSASVAYIGQSASYTTQLFKWDNKTGKSTSLFDPQKERMAALDLNPVTDWDFKSSNGTNIPGRYYLPPHFDANKKYPLIVYYYGGTTPVNRSFDSRYPFHLYAAMGYVVYVLQPSGAIGFGQNFSALHVNAWGKQTADDIIEGTKKFCATHPFVNPSKIGCIGASYGGFMTMYLQTRTDLFAAAISHAGISDISSYWGEGYWGYAYNAVAAADSYPWNNPELFTKQSPLSAADKIKTPLLLLHGDSDTNVPVGESLQMFTALKLLGSEVELLTFEGENHFIQDPIKRVLWQNSIFAWFAKWLQDDDLWWKDVYPTIGKLQ